ncbi:MAG TPA: S8 family serine peptidase [Solirubrobacterales bacterium]|nr:S8 family serine peptidase [Solirubrobacterales bacterium]
MPRLGSSIAAIALAALACAPAAWAAQDQPAPGAPATPAPAFSPTELIVQWAGGAGHGEKVDAREEAGVQFAEDLGNRRFQLVEVEPGQSARAALAALAGDPAVAVAERNSYSAPTAVPDDPLFGEQWALQNLGAGVAGFEGAVAGDDIHATEAWDRTVGSPSVVVADIDSGYRFEHPDLKDVAWTNPDEIPENGKDDDGDGIVDDVHGADFVGPNGESPVVDGDPTDEDLLSGGHGVHTAGIIGAAGNNGVGISGVAQDTRIMPLRVCSRFPSLEESRCPVSAQIAAINYAAQKGARVANLSLTANAFSQPVVNAIASHPGVLFVIAAGNDGGDNDGGEPAPKGHHYPCDYRPQLDASPAVPGAIDNILCVAATNQADELASFSDWGAASVDLGAPGTEILSTYPAVTPFADDFSDEASFTTNWPATGPDGGFERTEEAPLTSFGMTDEIGAPAPETVRETTSAPISLPPNGGCKLNQTRHVDLTGGGVFRYSVLLDGVSKVFSEPPSSPGTGLERRFLNLPSSFEAGGSVQIRFRFTTGEAPAPESGVWLDDVSLTCVQAVGQASGYAFLQGTSMAAPQVSGAAALLLAFEPATRVPELRHALMAGTDPDAALAGKTVSGGRLDVSGALDVLEAAPQAPTLASTEPASPANDNQPLILGSAPAGTDIDLYAGASCSGPVVASGSAEELESPGIAVQVEDNTTTQFTATATEGSGASSPCSAPIAYQELTPDETPPEPPQLTGTVPTSPGESATPRILGSAEAGSTVRLYLGAGCSEEAIASGSAGELASGGISVGIVIPEGVEQEFSARATDAADNTSACSGPISYRRLVKPIAGDGETVVQPTVTQPPSGGPGPATPGAPPPPAPCVVPRLAGKTLKAAQAALTKAHCALGIVRQPRPRPNRRERFVVASSNPKAGAVRAAGARVALRLVAKRSPRRHHR